MAKSKKTTESPFDEAIRTIRETKKGQEAAMYGPLRDLFCDLLGYPRSSVHIDIAGEAGRPDVTCRAPSGIKDRNGKSLDIDWMVVEAKDEHDAFSTSGKRETIFAQKAKYVRPDTAWFVMVDPTVFVARPVMTSAHDSANDIVLALNDTVDEATFRAKFARIAYGVAGVPQRLKAFREGDITLIATEKLTAPDTADKRQRNQVAVARRNFYETLRNTTGHLQESTLGTLQSVLSMATDVSTAWEEFGKKYPEAAFDPYTLTASARPGNYELAMSYGGDVARLNRKLKKAGSIARLALDGLPEFRARVNAKDDKQALEMFATETANLILARILLIRFFEDHGFFGPNRFLCNGGVEAFQKLREKFTFGYTRLLKMAYEKAQALYAAAFDETELDWVFATNDANLSNAIEWAMYQLSRYDFTTVKGDILTGVYDRFLDREQRKKFGEYYTPPSIARYIVDRLELKPEDRFMDPACGSGTFLIERYQQVVGEDADQGLATYPEVVAALERLAGNDLNTFSAVLAQIQILWHVLSFKDDLIVADEFPDIAISDKANSIIRPGVEFAQHGRFVELDQPEYGGIGGNPPYVRPERSGELDDTTREYFESDHHGWKGISAEANLYALFIYRALDGWCRRPNKWGENAGRLGFVVPLAICGTKENGDLRRLFGPDGRWTIKEIVDLEVIWRNIFDADVLPIVLIAEARPPRLPLDTKWLDKAEPLPDGPKGQQVKAARLQPWIDARLAATTPEYQDAWERLATRNRARWEPDQVIIKLADKSCIDFGDGSKRPTFDLAGIAPSLIDYADLFTPDGRIVTRITPERRNIIKKLRANPPMSSAFQEYWYKKKGEGRGSVSLDPPKLNPLMWEKRSLCGYGLAFRGKKFHSSDNSGRDVYKGENIIATAMVGKPLDTNIDISKASDMGIFKYQSVFPGVSYAVAKIERCPNATRFNPKTSVFTNTAIVFSPNQEMIEVPFDLVLTSRIYRHYYALCGRSSYLNTYRSDIYPTSIRNLPWNDSIAKVALNLESLRGDLVSACENHFRTEAAMFAALAALSLRPFRDVVKDGVKGTGGKVEWSESLNKGTDKIELSPACKALVADDCWHIGISDYLLDWVKVPDEAAALGLATALAARAGTEQRMVDRSILLDMPIPPDAATRTKFDAIVKEYREADHAKAIDAVVDKIDALIGPALGLDTADIASIRSDMTDDPFLKNITPRWPATETRIHGYRTGLDSSNRYN
ncbi:SAM-dependent methyltransferase [Sphingobium xenophagum]|uniref:site-specific DNA-methyltransferase (adenine-specific) n=1 Tax=Sphingobium xenophagum TaxID=121428 RepID=A0ABU1WZJ8_SPHXE|nr:N-6 DNA methylase [Sphingobium xenophagum]MDR7154748.1 SAM-dependent methyltransferase [Sphingobium xenophagum]